MKKALFIDRDGTVIYEPAVTFQVDSLDRLEFLPRAITSLNRIAGLDYELVMATNQDGLGSEAFPEESFRSVQNLMLGILKGEGMEFDDILIDSHLPEDNSPMRKPGTGMFGKYMSGDYDLAASYVIGDRLTDAELAKNLGAKAILVQPEEKGVRMVAESGVPLRDTVALITDDWNRIWEFLRLGERTAEVVRKTRETDISLKLDLDGGAGRESKIDTGLKFFDHMLEQIVHHAGIYMDLRVEGDLEVDEHHTVEDTAIVLGEAVYRALGSKLGIERYGFALPMDESRAEVLIDFGGRISFEWDVEFKREKVGDVPSEMFRHFFKSFAESAHCNLHISADGDNEHHKIEGIFKAFARAMRMAIARSNSNYSLPSSKGVL